MGIFRGLASPSNQHTAALAIGVGVALVAGVAGVYIIQGQTPWSKTRQPKPLSAAEWQKAFDTEGRLLNDGAQIIGRVRRGGVAPEIRSEVWPFLLEVHELDSTEGERKKKKLERRRKYARLRKQVEALSQRIQEDNARKEREEALVKEQRLAASRGEESGVSDHEEGGSGIGWKSSQGESVNVVALESSVERESKALELGVDQPESRFSNPGETSNGLSSSGLGSAITTAAADPAEESGGDSTERLEALDPEPSSQTSNPKPSSETPNLKPAEDAQALEEFQTWQRIIRLDAVRMNAAWIPYAPAQAACDPERAEEMARGVGLENDEHLEPARRAHAARLVAILEAYAVYDKETGYCQGMSDLLSPFVALIESDAEAFWCFQRFMRTAKHNFRIDEKGIRRQLDRIAAILEKGDPEFYQHLAAIGAGDCIFAYRMVVVLFRRELSFEQTLNLWEVCWADALAAARLEPVVRAATTVGGTVEHYAGQKRATKELLLFVIAAAVRQRRRKILDECTAMDEVLKECNAMANSVDLWRTINDARALVRSCAEE